MKKLYATLLLLFSAAVLFAQQSPVVLSSFKVTDVVDPSVGGLTSFRIEIQASEPVLLAKLEISFEDRTGSTEQPVVTIPVIVDDNKAALKFDKYATPFNGTKVSFFITVRDQFTAPYHKVFIKAHDTASRETNTLTFNRIN